MGVKFSTGKGGGKTILPKMPTFDDVDLRQNRVWTKPVQLTMPSIKSVQPKPLNYYFGWRCTTCEFIEPIDLNKADWLKEESIYDPDHPTIRVSNTEIKSKGLGRPLKQVIGHGDLLQEVKLIVDKSFACTDVLSPLSKGEDRKLPDREDQARHYMTLQTSPSVKDLKKLLGNDFRWVNAFSKKGSSTVKCKCTYGKPQNVAHHGKGTSEVDCEYQIYYWPEDKTLRAQGRPDDTTGKLLMTYKQVQLFAYTLRIRYGNAFDKNTSKVVIAAKNLVEGIWAEIAKGEANLTGTKKDADDAFDSWKAAERKLKKARDAWETKKTYASETKKTYDSENEKLRHLRADIQKNSVNAARTKILTTIKKVISRRRLASPGLVQRLDALQRAS